MKSRAGLVTGLMALVLLTGCAGVSTGISLKYPGLTPDGKYDFSTVFLNEDLERVASDWPHIFSSGKPVLINPDTKEKDIQDEKTLEGRAIVIPPYVLTPHHVVNLNKVSLLTMTPRGPRMVGVDANGVEDAKYWLEERPDGVKVPLTKVVFSEDKDWALFKLPPDAKIDAPSFVLGRSGELVRGNVVFLLGSPGLFGSMVREGIMAVRGTQLSEKALKKFSEQGLNLRNTIVISISAMPGDSGAGVVALRDGRPELIGMATAALLNTVSFVITIDSIVEEVREATGIDLRQK